MKKLHRAFFAKYLATFLIPMLIPLLILGTLSTTIIQQYIKEEINKSNMNFLKQTKENIELIFTELDSLHLHSVASAIEFVNVKTMLEKPYPDREDYRQLATFKNFIDSPAIARPYIDSIYIYINNNKSQFITSTTGGLVTLDEFYDQSWFESFRRNHLTADTWSERRTITKTGQPEGLKSTEVITMYRSLSISDDRDGVIVLNFTPAYIEQQLAQLATIEGQSLLIIDSSNDVIFKNNPSYYFNSLDIANIVAHPSSFFSLDLGQESFIVSKLVSDKYGWTFVSITPKFSLYEVPLRLSSIALFLLILSFLGGTVLAYWFTQKNSSDIKRIIEILEYAEHGKPLPPVPSRVKDVYSYIIHRILKNFIEHNYLKVQLSERKYKAQAMEFTALQSQLNPHFLYNTLETINWKAASLTGRPNDINKMIENLADILRYSLDGQHQLVILQQEIIYTQNYIEIQKVRYKDKFHVMWEYDRDVEKYNVLKLILQPLIENSIYHGIREKDTTGCIKIKAKAVRSFLTISVIDNGAGMTAEKLKQVREKLDTNSSQSKHIGLYNTHKRLKLAYGEQFGVIMQSKPGWGTVVRIRIPIG